jgi:PTS system nitrogen regulatory IIA component
MRLPEFLSPASMLVETRALDKTRVLTELAEGAAKPVRLDAERIITAILGREKIGLTGVGGGIAIPHAPLVGIDWPYGFLALVKRPIDFAAIEGEPDDVVFLLLSSDKPKDQQLSAFACATRRCSIRRNSPGCARRTAARDLMRRSRAMGLGASGDIVCASADDSVCRVELGELTLFSVLLQQGDF